MLLQALLQASYPSLPSFASDLAAINLQCMRLRHASIRSAVCLQVELLQIEHMPQNEYRMHKADMEPYKDIARQMLGME